MYLTLYYRTAAAFETQRIAVEGYKKKKDRNKIEAPKIRLSDAEGLSRDVHSLDPSKYANLIHRI